MTKSLNKVNKNVAKSDQHEAGGAGDADFPPQRGGGGNGEDLAKILCQHDNFVSLTDIVKDLHVHVY